MTDHKIEPTGRRGLITLLGVVLLIAIVFLVVLVSTYRGAVTDTVARLSIGLAVASAVFFAGALTQRGQRSAVLTLVSFALAGGAFLSLRTKSGEFLPEAALRYRSMLSQLRTIADSPTLDGYSDWHRAYGQAREEYLQWFPESDSQILDEEKRWADGIVNKETQSMLTMDAFRQAKVRLLKNCLPESVEDLESALHRRVGTHLETATREKQTKIKVTAFTPEIHQTFQNELDELEQLASEFDIKELVSEKVSGVRAQVTQEWLAQEKVAILAMKDVEDPKMAIEKLDNRIHKLEGSPIIEELKESAELARTHLQLRSALQDLETKGDALLREGKAELAMNSVLEFRAANEDAVKELGLEEQTNKLVDKYGFIADLEKLVAGQTLER